MKTHIINKWFDNTPEKKKYLETKINLKYLPTIDFINETVKSPNKLYTQLFNFADTFQKILYIIIL